MLHGISSAHAGIKALALRSTTVAREDLAQKVFEKYPRTKDISIGGEDSHSQDGNKPEVATENVAVMKHTAMMLKDRKELDRINHSRILQAFSSSLCTAAEEVLS